MSRTRHTWLKVLTSLLWSKKFRGLPDNDHRIVYFSHLILAKLGLENEPLEFLSAVCFVTKNRYKTIRARLISDELFDAHGKVIGFEDSQLTPQALRKRRQRERDAERDKSRPMSPEKTVTQAPDSREQIAYKKKNPPTPRARGAAKLTLTGHEAEAVALVVAHLNLVTGRQFDPGTAIDQIVRALREDRATAADCCQVIDHLWAQWGHKDEMRAAVDKTTPFRRANFKRYLDALRAGQPRPAAAPGTAAVVSREMWQELETRIADDEDWRQWIEQQPAAFQPRLTARARVLVTERLADERLNEGFSN